MSGVSRSIASRLGLPAVGKRPINTAGGVSQVERYLFRIGFPNDTGLPFVFDDLMGFELIESDLFEAVLGMDVLRRCDFSMQRDGTCTLQLA